MNKKLKIFFVVWVVALSAMHLIGTALRLYDVYEWYDVLQHTSWGATLALIAATGLNIIMKKSNYTRLAPLLFAFCCFCFSMTVGAVWEICEYTGDRLIGMNSQKSVYAYSTLGTEGFRDEAADYFSQNVVFYNNMPEDWVDTNGDGEGDTLMQRTGRLYDPGLVDIMEDIICNTCGAIAAMVGIYIYQRKTFHNDIELQKKGV